MTCPVLITEHKEGWVVPVRAQPGAKRTAVVGLHGAAIKLAVNAPPVDGKANEALRQALAEALGIRPGAVELLGAATSRDKRFLVRGVEKSDLEKRLADLIGAR
jgi:uncharacterized protein (TIGR00251 family)